MGKIYVDKNVYEAVGERLEYVFNEFENVLVSFSGGKDSGALLELAYDYAKETGKLDKLAAVHLDYEAQYQMTTDYVEETMQRLSDIRRYWICLPIYAQCACNMKGGYWVPWEKEKQNIWVRPMPEYDYVINEDNCGFEIREDDYEIPKGFFPWFADKYGKTAVLVGIRADESLHRLSVITSQKRVNMYQGIRWSSKQHDDVYNFYPIYDWRVEDIWTYYAKYEKPYNKLYDLFYQAGLTIDQMRVASPFNDCAGATLKYYRVIDPNNWGRMVGRVNGVNFLGIYGDTVAMGWKKISKPKHFTWKEYCYFLLDTLDEDTRQHYLDKLNTSIKFWKEKGGALAEETIAELEDEDVSFENRGKVSKISPKDVVTFDDYPDDLNVTNFKEVPTYKRMCVCIIKNDYYCKFMGFAQTKNELKKRQRAINMYKNL